MVHSNKLVTGLGMVIFLGAVIINGAINQERVYSAPPTDQSAFAIADANSYCKNAIANWNGKAFSDYVWMTASDGSSSVRVKEGDESVNLTAHIYGKACGGLKFSRVATIYNVGGHTTNMTFNYPNPNTTGAFYTQSVKFNLGKISDDDTYTTTILGTSTRPTLPFVESPSADWYLKIVRYRNWTVQTQVTPKVNGISIRDGIAVVGDTVTWTHDVRNSGPDKILHDEGIPFYAVMDTGYASGKTKVGTLADGAAKSSNWQAGSNSANHVISNSDIGKQFCRRTEASPQISDATSERGTASDKACFTVRSNFNLYPRTVINGGSGSSVSYITAGDSISPADIDQTISNTGSSSDTDRVTNNNAAVNEFIVKKENRADFLNNLNTNFNQTASGFRFGLGSWTSGDACSSWLVGKAPYVDCARGIKYDDNGNVKYLATSTKLPDTTSVEAKDDVGFGDMICRIVSVKDYNHQHSDANERRISVPSCVMVTKQPKVQFSGADVRSNNNVYTSSTLTSRGLYGSWAEFAVMSSAGTVRSVSGAALSTDGAIGQSRSEVDRNKLTFANVSSTGVAYYGNFGGTFTQPTIAARYPSSSLPALPSSAQVSDLVGGTHTRAGDLTLGGGEINQKVVIRSTGTVTITGDITYANGPYASSSVVPQLIIIAKNIVINDNVGRVDAWLVADTDGGYVSTCGAVSGTNWSDGLNATVCAGRLTVNGPIVADHLYLKRTFGESGDQPDNNPGTPAEIINLRPDAYLYASSQSQSTGSIRTMNIKELPPRF